MNEEQTAPEVFIDWVNQNLPLEKEIIFEAKVTTSSPKTEIYGILDDGTIKIRLIAQPEKGRANQMLIKYLEDLFVCDAEILSGETAEIKKIKLSVSDL